MNAVIRRIVAYDTRVQHVFDACIFFLMRRFGWKKSFVTYIFWAAQVAITAMLEFTTIKIHGLGIMIAAQAFGFAVLFSLLIVVTKAEQNAEEMGKMHAPPHLVSFWSKTMKVYLYADLVFLKIPWLWSPMPEKQLQVAHWVTADRYLDLIWTAWWLLCTYLIKTPLTPPPTAEKKTLVPAHVSA